MICQHSHYHMDCIGKMSRSQIKVKYCCAQAQLKWVLGRLKLMFKIETDDQSLAKKITIKPRRLYIFNYLLFQNLNIRFWRCKFKIFSFQEFIDIALKPNRKLISLSSRETVSSSLAQVFTRIVGSLQAAKHICSPSQSESLV